MKSPDPEQAADSLVSPAPGGNRGGALTLRRLAAFAVPPLVCLAVFWRLPFIWFRIDDFAWLSLPLEVDSLSGLLDALFRPAAQGTVRVFSERAYFLTLGSLFGITSWPFRIVSFATWSVCLVLMQLIGARLTGSRAAGFLAALLWTVSVPVVLPLVWASAYNQILCALLVLTAFYARLRWLEASRSDSANTPRTAARWRWIEAGAYLLGFGALETIVMYPAVVLLHAFADREARKHWRSSLWMWIPASLFTAAHLFVIPKVASPIYQRIVDARLPATLWQYLEWTLGPSQIQLRNPAREWQGLLVTWAIAAALLGFVAVRLLSTSGEGAGSGSAQRDLRPLLFCGWFLLWIAPVLPLPNHVVDYYLIVPGIGMAWLAGWALTRAWGSGLAFRLAGAVLALGFVAGSVVVIDSATEWWLRISSRMRIAYRWSEGTLAKYPGTTLVLAGTDEDIVAGGLLHEPFRLAGAERVLLAPGLDYIRWANTEEDRDDITSLMATAGDLLDLLETGQARVLDLSGTATGGPALDVTAPYQAIVKAQAAAVRRGQIDFANPSHATQLGAGWYAIENGGRWSSGRASVRMTVAGDVRQLRVSGYGAAAALENGPIEIRFRLLRGDAPTEVGSIRVEEADRPFEIILALPDGIAAGEVSLELECSRTLHTPGDERELGMFFTALTLE